MAINRGYVANHKMNDSDRAIDGVGYVPVYQCPICYEVHLYSEDFITCSSCGYYGPLVKKED